MCKKKKKMLHCFLHLTYSQFTMIEEREMENNLIKT